MERAGLGGETPSFPMPERHHRRSVRLGAHDYRGGLYFVTVCTAERQRLFGDVEEHEMRLSEAGRIAHDEWLRTGDVRPDVVLDAFVVMPDHVHLLFGIVGRDTGGATGHLGAPGHRRDTPPVCPYPDGEGLGEGNGGRRFGWAVAGSVSSIMRQYKSVVTKRARRLSPGLCVWQGRFYDRVVRTDREADAIRRYVAENPARWDPDRPAPGHRA